jgi:FkbM family methyltransferase
MSRFRKTMALFRRLDGRYFLSGIWLLWLQVCFYLLRLLLGRSKACGVFRDRRVEISLEGTRFLVNAVPGDLGYILECFIQRTYESLPGFAPEEGNICLDIGANIGSCSLSWLRRNRTGKILSCEPQPETFERLSANIGLNGPGDINVLQVAVSSRSGQIEMYSREDSSMAVAFSSGTSSDTIAVQAVTLDELVDSHQLDRIDLCKIDVEGHEVEVLKGGEKAIGMIRRLVIEYHSKELRSQVLSILDRTLSVIRVDESDVGLIFAERTTEVAVPAVT